MERQLRGGETYATLFPDRYPVGLFASVARTAWVARQGLGRDFEGRPLMEERRRLLEWEGCGEVAAGLWMQLWAVCDDEIARIRTEAREA